MEATRVLLRTFATMKESSASQETLESGAAELWDRSKRSQRPAMLAYLFQLASERGMPWHALDSALQELNTADGEGSALVLSDGSHIDWPQSPSDVSHWLADRLDIQE